jgi:hypothetical protein
MKKLLLLLLSLVFSFNFSSISYANYLDAWSDNSICSWLKTKPEHSGYQNEAKKRGLTCDDGVATKTLLNTQEAFPVLPENVEIFTTPDISQATIQLITEWYKIGTDAWGAYGPVEIYVIGNKVSDAKKLEDDFCIRHIKKDKGWSKKWDCASENHKIFTPYAEEGGAAVSTYKKTHLNYDFSALIMSSSRPRPTEEDYKFILLHEYFHIFQHGHISGKCSDDRRILCERDKKSTGEYEKRPWFQEGGAEYRGHLLFSEKTSNKNFLKQAMKRKLERSLNDYRHKYKMDLKGLTYKKGKKVAYNIGSWMIAYLIHHEGIAMHNNFYKDLDELGFESSFEKNFGKTSDDYIKEFNEFITQPQWKVLEIIP